MAVKDYPARIKHLVRTHRDLVCVCNVSSLGRNRRVEIDFVLVLKEGDRERETY